MQADHDNHKPSENKAGLTKVSLKWLQIKKKKVQIKRGDLCVLIG